MREAGVASDSAVVTTLHRRRLALGEAELGLGRIVALCYLLILFIP